MAFVNALAWIANVENHHPDLELVTIIVMYDLIPMLSMVYP